MVLAFRERQSRQNRLVSSRFVELVAEEAAAISEDLDAEQQALKDCFEKLPEAKRELLYLRYYPGRQTVQEIAAKLGRITRPRERPSCGPAWHWPIASRRRCTGRTARERSADRQSDRERP